MKHIQNRCCVCCKHWIDLCSTIGHTRCGDIFRKKSQHTTHIIFRTLFVGFVYLFVAFALFSFQNTHRATENEIYFCTCLHSLNSHNNAPFIHLSMVKRFSYHYFRVFFLLFVVVVVFPFHTIIYPISFGHFHLFQIIVGNFPSSESNIVYCIGSFMFVDHHRYTTCLCLNFGFSRKRNI